MIDNAQGIGYLAHVKSEDINLRLGLAGLNLLLLFLLLPKAVSDILSTD